MSTKHLRPGLRSFALTSLLALAAMSTPASAAEASAEEIPLADYLALLARIAPAAQEGAQAYLQAHQRRCGRALGTAQLRRAMSQGDGEPILMAMIRASHLRDPAALARLGGQVRCEQGPRS